MAIEAARLKVTVGADTSDAEKGIAGFDKKMTSTTQKMAQTGGMMDPWHYHAPTRHCHSLSKHSR